MFIAIRICEVRYMYWYVLFIQTGREQKIEQFLRRQLNSDVCMPFIPLQELLFKKSGITSKEVRPLFPGYVFVESELQGQQFLKVISSLTNRLSEMACVLKYSDTEIAMKEAERQMLLSLCNNDHCIESSYGIMDGDKIHIIDGPLKGLESIVKKVNRHKRQAWIEIEIMGDVRLVGVALEVVEKVEKDR